jgi:thermitase
MNFRRWSAPLLALTLLASAIVAPTSSAQDARPSPFGSKVQAAQVRRQPLGSSYVPGQLIVRLRDGSALAARSASNTQALAARFGRLKVSATQQVAPRTFQLQVAANADVEALAREIAADADVAYAQPNYRFHALRSVNDPLSTFQYALNKIDAAGAWNVTTGSNAVTIAVVDTGVLPNHPDFTGRVLPGFDFINNDADATDDEGHGTHTAGIAAAAGDNGEGIAGMCWQCRILPVKVLDDEGAGSSLGVALGIRWAADNGARVINLSLGGDEDSPFVREAVRYAVSKNALVIAAAGNSADLGNPVEYPAAYDEVIAVGATDENDQRAFFSQVQGYVDVSAPGWNIPSTFEPSIAPYLAFSGTSEAAPHVAGLAGLLLSVNPSLDVNALRSIITGTTDDLGTPGPDPEYGTGRINAGRAVAAVRIPAFDPVPNPNQPDVAYFPETQHTLSGEFKRFWEQNGGLQVFGFPISQEFQETTAEGTYTVQYFERNRFEFHPENAPPYNVLLGRLSDVQLRRQGRDWFTFPKGQETPGCQFFAETGHTVCEPFLSYWKSNGLRDPKLSRDGQSLALFGLPLSEAMPEVNSSGDTVVTQWFERARFEFHPDKPAQYQVLLGLLGNETARGGTASPPPVGGTPPNRCEFIPPSVDINLRPGNCIVALSVISFEAYNFAPGEEIAFVVGNSEGQVAPQDPLVANEQGRVGFADVVFPFPPGLYTLAMQGTQSGHQSVAFIKVVDR